MPDIFLRAGEPNPKDVRLFDPTAAPAGGLSGTVATDSLEVVAASATLRLTGTVATDSSQRTDATGQSTEAGTNQSSSAEQTNAIGALTMSASGALSSAEQTAATATMSLLGQADLPGPPQTTQAFGSLGSSPAPGPGPSFGSGRTFRHGPLSFRPPSPIQAPREEPPLLMPVVLAPIIGAGRTDAPQITQGVAVFRTPDRRRVRVARPRKTKAKPVDQSEAEALAILLCEL